MATSRWMGIVGHEPRPCLARRSICEGGWAVEVGRITPCAPILLYSRRPAEDCPPYQCDHYRSAQGTDSSDGEPVATVFRKLSNIQKHSRLPAAVRLLDSEIVKRHRFHVRALMMPSGSSVSPSAVAFTRYTLSLSSICTSRMRSSKRSASLRKIAPAGDRIATCRACRSRARSGVSGATESPRCCRSSRSSSRQQRP